MKEERTKHGDQEGRGIPLWVRIGAQGAGAGGAGPPIGPLQGGKCGIHSYPPPADPEWVSRSTLWYHSGTPISPRAGASRGVFDNSEA